MAYSIDFRKKVLETREKEKLSFMEIAVRFGVGKTTVVRWTQRLEAKKTRNRPPSKINMDALKIDIEAYPDAFQYERAERFGVSRTGIKHALRRLGVTYKKNSKSSQGGLRKKICILPANN